MGRGRREASGCTNSVLYLDPSDGYTRINRLKGHPDVHFM